MAEPSSLLKPAPAEGAPEYRPLSSLALVALIGAALYAALVALLTVASLFSNTPLFVGIWTLIFPALTLSLGLIAKGQIRRSEGTLGGLALTSWAWWLSVLFGLGFAAFYGGTCLAVCWQAEDFVQKWFDKIRKGEIREAFVDTQNPTERKFDKPGDPEYMFNRYTLRAIGVGKGNMTGFQESEVVRIIEQGGPTMTIQSQGIKDWGYEKGGYKVQENYRIITPEGIFTLQMVVRSTDSKELEDRQWRVAFENVHFLEPTIYYEMGAALKQAAEQARTFASEWLTKRFERKDVEAYLDTLTREDRKQLLRQTPLRNMLGAFALGREENPLAKAVEFGALGNDEVSRETYLPGFREYLAGGIIRSDELEAPRKIKADIVAEVRRNFYHPFALSIRPESEAKARPEPPADPATGPLRMLFDVNISVLTGTEAASPAKYKCDGAVLVESDPGPLTQNRHYTWRVAGLQLLRGAIAVAEERKRR
jgi:hypothetical protein